MSIPNQSARHPVTVRRRGLPAVVVALLLASTPLSVDAKDCGAQGGLFYLGNTRDDAKSVWLSATSAGAFKLEAAEKSTVVDQWAKTRRGLNITASPFVSNGNGGTHKLYETSGNKDCLLDTQNQKGGINLPQLNFPNFKPPSNVLPPIGTLFPNFVTGVMPTLPGGVRPPVGGMPNLPARPPTGVMPTLPGGVTPPIGALPPTRPPTGVMPTLPGGVTPPIGALPPARPPTGVMPTVPGGVAPPVGTLPPTGVTPGLPTRPPTGVMPTLPGGVTPPVGTLPPTGVTPGLPTQPPTGVMPTMPGGVTPPVGTLPPTGVTPGVPTRPPTGVTPTVPGGVTPPVGTLPPTGVTPGVPTRPPTGVTPPVGTLPPTGVTPGVPTRPPTGVTPPVGTLPPTGVTPTVPGGVTPPVGTLPPTGITPGVPTQPPTGLTPTVPGGVTPPVGTLPPTGVTPGVPTRPPTGVTPTVPGGVVPPVGTLPPTGVTPTVPGGVTPPVGTLPPTGITPGVPTQPPTGLTPTVPGGVTPPVGTLPPTVVPPGAPTQPPAVVTPGAPGTVTPPGVTPGAPGIPGTLPPAVSTLPSTVIQPVPVPRYPTEGATLPSDCPDPRTLANQPPGAPVRPECVPKPQCWPDSCQAGTEDQLGQVPITPGRDLGVGLSKDWNVWTDVRFLSTSDGRYGLDIQGWSRSATAGIDRRVGSNVVLGVSATLEDSKVGGYDGFFSSSSRGWTIGPYAALMLSDNWAVDAALGYSRLSNNYSLAVLEGSYVSQRLTGSANLHGQYSLDFVEVRPRLSFAFVKTYSDGYDMRGSIFGQALSISYPSADYDYSTLELAVEFNKLFTMANGNKLMPFAEAGVLYEMVRPNGGTILNGDLQPFTPSPWSFSAKAGVRMLINDSIMLEARAGYLSFGQAGLDVVEAKLHVSFSF